MTGFFDKLFGSEKGKVQSTSNEFLNKLRPVIEQAKWMVSKSPKVDTIQNLAIDVVEGFFYSNLINNYKNNLNEENLKELNITQNELKKIYKEFEEIFDRCDETIESGSNEGKINSNVYQDFRQKIGKISKGAFKLVLEIEKHIDIDSCKNEITQFKKDIKLLGKELKVSQIKNYGDKAGFSIGFDIDDEDYNEDDMLLEKVTDFNNFSIDIDDEWITLGDKEGEFYGQYSKSNNNKYIVAYCDAHGEEDEYGNEKTISGQVYLIENERKILWQKDISRPNGAFVTNDGIVVIIDWISFTGELAGKIYFFSKNGKKLFEKKFSSNIGGQAISDDGTEIIVTTANPENTIYLFSIRDKKLVKKAKNSLSKKPLINFDFNEVKELVLKEQPYIQLKKQKTIKKKLSPFEELMNKGYLCKESGKFQKGIEYFKEAMKIKTTGSLLKGVGYCYMGLGNFKEAINFFEKAMEISPYQKKMLPKYIELCRRKKKSFDDCTQEEIDEIYLKAENRDLKKERSF
ncbi:tetratricopeptide repeat protein [Candidatus Woesearchaeota archaeon]|nr:tetratricopeptide repeat protein [Candidatus Woesearchaeota archaeon]